MKKYRLRFRTSVWQLPFILLLAAPIFGLAMQFVHPNPDFEWDAMMIIAAILSCLPLLAAVTALLTISFTVILTNENLLIVKSVLRRVTTPISDIQSVIRSTYPPRIQATAHRVAFYTVVFGAKKASFVMSSEDTEAFHTELLAMNSTIQFYGFATINDVIARPDNAVPTGVARPFMINTRGRDIGFTMYSIAAIIFIPATLLFMVVGVILLIGDSSVVSKKTTIPMIIGPPFILLGAVLYPLWQELEFPQDVALYENCLYIKTRIRTLVIAAGELQRLRVYGYGRELRVEIRYLRGSRVRAYRFPLTALPEFLEFAAALCRLNPAMQTVGV